MFSCRPASNTALWHGALLAVGCAAHPVPAAISTIPSETSQTGLSSPNTALLGPAPRSLATPQSSVEFVLDSVWRSPSAAGNAEPELWLLARFRIPAGYHLYWSNPGETGLETVAQFAAPAPFSMGEIRYPGPTRFRSERGSTSYGYEGETALLARASFTGAAPLTHDFTFRARASWLSCSAVCVKEQAEASLALGEHPSGEWLSLEQMIQRLPLPFSQSGAEAKRISEGEVEFVAPPGMRLLEYFPLAKFSEGERDVNLSSAGDGGILRVNHASLGKPNHGVLSAMVGNKLRWFTVSVP